MKTLAIGRAAAATGLSADTIRYYERRGILPNSERSDSGCRRYDQAALDMLLVIRRGRDAGLPLPVLAQLLRRGGVKPGVLRAQLTAIDQSIEELHAWRTALQFALDQPSGDTADLLVRQLCGVTPRPPKRRK